MGTKKLNAGIYIHIPFCVKKCAYCDFPSFPANEEMKHRYVSALIYEIEHRRWPYEIENIPTIFIGGGTPSSLSVDELGRLIRALKRTYHVLPNAEFTMEVNPKTVDKEKLIAIRQLGVNRLSIGLQSTIDEELRLLGRIHSFDDFLKTYDDAREAGFTNINFDIIYALPGQGLLSLEKTLRRVTELRPEHISAYSLIIEEGTRFYTLYGDDEKRRQKGERPIALPTEETERAMDRLTKEILEEAGYHRYEISNYARDGFECEHNKVYWTRGSYIGFGISAASLIGDIRCNNGLDMARYIEHGPDFEEHMLTRKEEVEEFMFLGLRMDRGISKKKFEKDLNIPYNDVYRETTDVLIRDGLIEEDDDYIRLTEHGRDISNHVLAEFLI